MTSFLCVVTNVPGHFSRLFVDIFTSGKDLIILSPVLLIWRNVPYPTVAMMNVVPSGEAVRQRVCILHATEPAGAVLQRFEQRF